MPCLKKPAFPEGLAALAPASLGEPCEFRQGPSKLSILIALLQAPEGATIIALCDATGWQSHSVRGAMAGALKRKGYVITSLKPDEGPRRYRIGEAA